MRQELLNTSLAAVYLQQCFAKEPFFSAIYYKASIHVSITDVCISVFTVPLVCSGWPLMLVLHINVVHMKRHLKRHLKRHALHCDFARSLNSTHLT